MFESIHYPVLPDVEPVRRKDAAGEEQAREILHIRNSRLFTPRDFDSSPFFHVVKPT